MKKWIVLILLGTLFAHCEDVIDVDLNTAAPRLVIDARLELREDGTSVNQIKLTRSAGFFEEENPVVTDAIVSITDGNGRFYPFTYIPESRLYTNQTLEIENDTNYTLEIIDGDQTYTASQQLVTTVPLEGIIEEELEGFGDFTQITAFFTDPEELGNYYLFTYQDGESYDVDTSDDEFINGNRTPTSFFIEDLEPQTALRLTITGIDRGAYRFFETLLQQTNGGGGGPFDTQPATVRGNVVNSVDADQFPFGYFRVSQVYVLDYVSQ